jgi:uncharacterized protein
VTPARVNDGEMESTAPLHPDFHLVRDGDERLLFLVNGSQLFGLDAETYDRLDRARHSRVAAHGNAELERLKLVSAPWIDGAPPEAPPLRALSLAVAQKCNLGCTYCYAQGGEFGGPAKQMERATACKAVDALFHDARAGERVSLSFLGGEPLLAREVIHAATAHAVARSAATGVEVRFAITTNGTNLREDDGDFFEQHEFAVTISLDGVGETHDRLRSDRAGRGSYDRILANVSPLLARQKRMQVSARVTVTPQNLRLRETLDAFIALGFHSVGFSPLLRSPTGREELSSGELEVMLAQMIDCGEEFERRLLRDERYPFVNLVNALQEIHRGTHRPYPCGAGAGYLGVSADGDLSACHRFVGDADGAMGHVATGVDRKAQRIWLSERHVHRQEPCNSCWARYLCGGGCHHEVIRRGRPACDYIRGWLHYCLGAYDRVRTRRPDWFGAARVGASS